MTLRAEDLPQDIDQLIKIVLAQEIEIEKYKTALKTVQALAFGARSERGAVILENQLSLGLDDGVRVAPPAANDEEVFGLEAGAAGAAKTCTPRAKARRNRGFLPKHLERIERNRHGYPTFSDAA